MWHFCDIGMKKKTEGGFKVKISRQELRVMMHGLIMLRDLVGESKVGSDEDDLADELWTKLYKEFFSIPRTSVAKEFSIEESKND